MRASILGALLLLFGAAPGVRAGALVDVTVEIAGRPVPLHHAVDGSGRLYFEARPGAGYTLRLANRTHERLGAVVVVDGLNVVSGEREVIGAGRPGRMYVLGPWDTVDIQGWRTSLDEVRRFTFVDERASYAARAGKANSRMGWVEIAVHRERYRAAVGTLRRDGAVRDEKHGRDAARAPASAPEAAAGGQRRAEDSAEHASGRVMGGVVGGSVGAHADPGPGHHPGTGWGASTRDHATEVHFDAVHVPAERITLRYEYASSLRAMGILPPRAWPHGRLGERDRGDGFARPPRW